MKIRKAVSEKPETLRRLLGHHADLQIGSVDIAVVDLVDLSRPLLVRGDVVDGLAARHPQRFTEVVVARHTALAVTR